jgi:predicted O-linked N-acetylglucosamine transferase (SPINDLY family)
MASARAFETDEAEIRGILEPGIDWTRFARKVTDHGVACLCGSTLARVAPDLIPEDVLDAFRLSVERTRATNRAAFNEIAGLSDALARAGIDVIALRGPVLAIQAFGDLGLREFGRCDLLVRESDVASVSARVRAANKAGGHGANVRTGLTGAELTLDISYAELRYRARRADLNGHPMLTLAPEDGLLVLAVHGSEGMWWRIKWACDVAAFIGSHPDLDWEATITRAHEMGCSRMLLLALSLARRYFGSKVPERATGRANPLIDTLVERIVESWRGDAAHRVAEAFSPDLLRLHNGTVRQGRYLARALLLPRWRHRVSIPVRRQLEHLPTRIGGLLRKPFSRGDRHYQPRRAANDGETRKKPDLADDPHEPRDAGAWVAYAHTLFDSKRFGEAVEASDHALQLDPANVEAKHLGVFARLKACDWRRLEDDKRWIVECAKSHPQVIWPSLPQLLDFDKGSDLERLAIEQIPASGHARLPEPLWRGERYQHPEIRVAYISAGFSSDPMAALATGILEHHDKGRFDVTAISLGRDTSTPMRGRIQAASRRFIQADKMSDAEIASMLRGLQVDVAVDLNTYTGKRNAAILAFRPAPVQVSFGYPGTTALPYMSHIIADRIVIPQEHRNRFSENVVYLPPSFQPNDCNRPTAEETPTRAEVGLPASGFVFACFNTSYKITPTLFDIWMRLLQRVENSVLWLLEDNVSANLNLRREARMRDVDPARLIFAPRIPSAKNVARQRLADLFLDTLPMNAHATASDALWAGLPVLTCLGSIFRSRVAASLLHAVGLPELATGSLAEYEELALALAHDAPRLNAIKANLARNRNTAPLFDTPRFTRYLEAAYTAMWQRSREGLPPAAFSVDA